MVSLPTPDPTPVCYCSHFTSVVFGRRDKMVLVDFPTGFNSREKKWIPEEYTKLL